MNESEAGGEGMRLTGCLQAGREDSVLHFQGHVHTVRYRCYWAGVSCAYQIGSPIVPC